MQRIYFTLSLLFIVQITTAQVFTSIQTGDIVNTPSASRSANFVDVNNDGWDDIFISNGPSAGQNNLLYLNNQDGTFTTVTDDPIVMDNGKSDGTAFADMDNDGDLDAIVVTWYGQRNFLYKNQGDGSFEFLEEHPISNLSTYSETAAWGDYNADGWLDLYVTNSEGSSKRNQLFQNQQNGNFERITAGALVLDSRPSRSADWIDYDGDSDLDLFVTNEGSNPNHLFQNNGGTFTKITNHSLVADTRNSTGSSWADIDNDGDFDLFVANFQNQNNQLFINDGTGQFTERTTGELVTDGGCSFGSAFADYDNDGDLDLFVCNAFCAAGNNNFLYENQNGVFTKITTETPATDLGWTFGCAWGDLNNDGYLDLVLANCKDENQTNALYQNNGGTYNYLKINAITQNRNNSAIGTVIRAKATIAGQEIWQTRHITSQSGYCSQNSLTVHFGLENATQVDSLIVEWGSGQRDTLTNITVNQQCTIAEGTGMDCAMTTNLKPTNIPLTALNIYPNPAQDSIAISFSSLARDTFSVRIFNSVGQLVQNGQSEWSGQGEMQLEIPIAHLAKGIYTVEVLGTHSHGTGTVVIE